MVYIVGSLAGSELVFVDTGTVEVFIAPGDGEKNGAAEYCNRTQQWMEEEDQSDVKQHPGQVEQGDDAVATKKGTEDGDVAQTVNFVAAMDLRAACNQGGEHLFAKHPVKGSASLGK